MWMGHVGVGTRALSPGPTRVHIRCDSPSLAPMVVTTSVSGSSSTPKRRRYRLAMANRSLGMPRDAEYRWLRGLWAASHSFSTAMSGLGMSGLPNPMSMTSSPAWRAWSRSWLMMAKTYGGRPLMRRNSIGIPRLPALFCRARQFGHEGGPVDAGRRPVHRPRDPRLRQAGQVLRECPVGGGRAGPGHRRAAFVGLGEGGQLVGRPVPGVPGVGAGRGNGPHG